MLTAFDGEAITYDASGNPLSYYNGSRYTFAWAEGRRLTSAAVNGKTYTYAYDSDGLRLSKTVDGVTHNYFYASGNLLRETWGTNILDFFYDNTGSPYALNYNGTTYYYITNLQGDVLGLIDASGNSVASYTYDPYGKVLTATGAMAETNPLRYRGYYYDSETELYYLQSRYYDPTTCRFINADAYASTGQGVLGHNMFAYCLNNAVNGSDSCGTCFHRWDFWKNCEKCAKKLKKFKKQVKNFFSDVGDMFETAGKYIGKAGKYVGKKIVQAGKYIFNTDEQIVIDAKYIAFYRGVPIIKIPIGKDAFSFGIIFMGDEVKSEDDIQHEYGHSVHFSQTGIVGYLSKSAIPSLIGFWSGVKYPKYYSLPWERIADIFGEVNRDDGTYDYIENSDLIAWIYWGLTMLP